MVQNLLLIVLVLLCILLTISIFQKPLGDANKNPCRFKILPPKYIIDNKKKYVCFNIIVEKKHRYFINFPLLFKFYGDAEFRSRIRIHYSTPGDKKQLLLDKIMEFVGKTKEQVVYITDIIIGKILIEIELEVEEGDPIIGFEILENTTCTLIKEHKLELIFPKETQ